MTKNDSCAVERFVPLGDTRPKSPTGRAPRRFPRPKQGERSTGSSHSNCAFGGVERSPLRFVRTNARRGEEIVAVEQRSMRRPGDDELGCEIFATERSEKSIQGQRQDIDCSATPRNSPERGSAGAWYSATAGWERRPQPWRAAARHRFWLRPGREFGSMTIAAISASASANH